LDALDCLASPVAIASIASPIAVASVAIFLYMPRVYYKIKRGTAPGPVVILTSLFLDKLCPKSPLWVYSPSFAYIHVILVL
jgi:hypothetical protein